MNEMLYFIHTVKFLFLIYRVFIFVKLLSKLRLKKRFFATPIKMYFIKKLKARYYFIYYLMMFAIKNININIKFNLKYRKKNI